MTPKLILQPIVENAITHGIIPSDRCCMLKISNRVEDDRIIFTVSDTGIGMSPQRLTEIRSLLNDVQNLPNKNIGLTNVNMRIKLMFGDLYGCKILHSDENGTTIEILIPKIKS